MEPKIIFDFFKEINKVPRPSKREEKIIKYLKETADKYGLGFKTDDYGNVLISATATSGYENSDGVILQAHMDMVCEKECNLEFDFETQPIETYIDGDWMMAKGTTTTPYFHEIQVSFTLTHQMGLLITKDVLSYYRLGNPSETWTETQTFSPNIPYSIGDLRYYFAKPDTPTTLGSKTTTVDAGQVEQLYFTNGEPVE